MQLQPPINAEIDVRRLFNSDATPRLSNYEVVLNDVDNSFPLNPCSTVDAVLLFEFEQLVEKSKSLPNASLKAPKTEYTRHKFPYRTDVFSIAGNDYTSSIERRIYQEGWTSEGSDERYSCEISVARSTDKLPAVYVNPFNREELKRIFESGIRRIVRPVLENWVK